MKILKTGRSVLVAAAFSLATTAALAQEQARDLGAGSANVYAGGNSALALATGRGKPDAVADFLASRGHGAGTVASLVTTGEHRNPNLGVSHLRMSQEVDGLTVYGTYVKAAFDDDGNLIHLIENLANANGNGVVAAAAGPRDALDAALGQVHPGRQVSLAEAGRSGNTTSFGGDDFFHRDPTVTAVAIAMANGTLHEGYLVETWSDEGNLLHHTLIGGNGRALSVQLRTNNDSYNIFPDHPENSSQTVVAGPGAGNTESPSGWLFGSQTTVDIAGNNANAYLDTDNNNAADTGGLTVSDGNFLTGANLGADPSTTGNQEVAVQNLFYLNNVIHDKLYRHGFIEGAGNFQEDNFGNGGSSSDSVNAEAQDGGGTNNANFATPSDGSNPRMQMYIWTLTTPNRDGDVDSDIVNHEYGHGLTWRMIGNMGGPMSGAIGEGMGDVLSILANDDPVVGEYSTGDPLGIRSASYEGYGRTYGDMTGSSVHFDGEIYAATIWHLWGLFQGASVPKDSLYDYLIGGMNFTASGPAMEDMRDGILTAANGTGDECLIWEAFAAFGIGEGADGRVQGGGPFGGGKLKITESFSLPSECSGPPNDAPSVSITAPVDGDTFTSGTEIAFAGNATDTEDDDTTLTGSIDWTSSIDGPIGTGGAFSIVLSDGIHTITASVTDSGGKSASESITITVGDVSGNPNAMYVANIVMGKKGPHLNITVTIKRDSNADGTADAGDAVVAGAVPDVSLCLDGGACWFETTEVATDSNGISKYKLLHAPSGDFTFTVHDMAHGTYTYSSPNALDSNNPASDSF